MYSSRADKDPRVSEALVARSGAQGDGVGKWREQFMEALRQFGNVEGGRVWRDLHLASIEYGPDRGPDAMCIKPLLRNGQQTVIVTYEPV